MAVHLVRQGTTFLERGVLAMVGLPPRLTPWAEGVVGLSHQGVRQVGATEFLGQRALIVC